jgi:hypothetical protein
MCPWRSRQLLNSSEVSGEQGKVFGGGVSSTLPQGPGCGAGASVLSTPRPNMQYSARDRWHARRPPDARGAPKTPKRHYPGSRGPAARDQRANRGELSPHPALHGPSGQLGWAGGWRWSRGFKFKQKGAGAGPLGCWLFGGGRASPTGASASASSFAPPPY